MTLTEVVVSAVILGISSQVSLQGWSRTSQAAASSARMDQQLPLLEQQLLASRRALALAPVANPDCSWNHEAVAAVLEGLPKDANLETTWRLEPSTDGLWLVVELTDSEAANSFKRSQLITPAGLGHCPREVSDDQ